MHRQGPCQLAAFVDAIWRTKGGESRWLGIWDVDEFIFPPETSRYTTLAETLRREFPDHAQVRIYGNVFGTSGHVHPAQRKEGDPLQPLVTEEYIYRAEVDRMSLLTSLIQIMDKIHSHRSMPTVGKSVERVCWKVFGSEAEMTLQGKQSRIQT
jgi:hypothetical protein